MLQNRLPLRMGKPVANGVFTCVPKWRVADIVGQTCRLHDDADISRRDPSGQTVGQLIMELFCCHHTQRAPDTRDFKRVSQTGMNTQLIGQGMYLSLLIELTKRVRKYQPVIVFMKLRASAGIGIVFFMSAEALSV